jgi:transcriptional regulator with XRE-family HTH domain
MKYELKKAIGQRMRKIRKALGYTQEKMVSFFDIGRANYSRIEKGEVFPGANILHTLRAKFNVSLDWLITNTGKMFAQDQERKEYNEYNDKIYSDQYKEEIRELLSYVERVPMVKHAIISFFLEYKIRHQKMIQQFLEDGEMSVPFNINANDNFS